MHIFQVVRSFCVAHIKSLSFKAQKCESTTTRICACIENGCVRMCFILKLHLVKLFTIFYYFINVCLSQITVNRPGTFVPIDLNWFNASSLICHKEQCLSAVHIAIQCSRETDCLGWFYDDTAITSCSLCQCPVDAYTKHSPALKGELHVLDTPWMKKGIQN